MDDRVVITGLVAVTPLGNTWQETWSGLKDGRSGVARIIHFDPAGLPTQIAAEVKGFDPNVALSVKQVNRMSRTSQLAVTVAACARCAHSYAEVLGGTQASDAFNVVAPEPSGLYAGRAIARALDRAKMNPSDIDMICAHGTSTRMNDATDTKAIKRAFGEAASVRCRSVKV